MKRDADLDLCRICEEEPTVMVEIMASEFVPICSDCQFIFDLMEDQFEENANGTIN